MNEFKKLLQSMEDLADPYRFIQNDIQQMFGPHSELQKQVFRLTEHEHIQPYMYALENLMLNLEEEIHKNTNFTQILNPQLNDFFDSHLEISNQMAESLCL